MVLLATILFLPLFVWVLFYLFNKYENWDYLNMSSFECGFSPNFFCRFSNSVPFFIILIIFLFLDLEFCIILPYLYNFSEWLNFNILTFLTFLIMLGIFLEWNMNSLNWMD